jgi:hypothetical protein
VLDAPLVDDPLDEVDEVPPVDCELPWLALDSESGAMGRFTICR